MDTDYPAIEKAMKLLQAATGCQVYGKEQWRKTGCTPPRPWGEDAGVLQPWVHV